MVRVPHRILMMAVLVLPACSGESDDASTVPVQAEGVPAAGTPIAVHEYQENTWRERYLALGRETYEQVCASCHDDNEDGAPAKGDRESWSNRSPLWAAVLFEHAKDGYLDMPAKGGHPELTERAVEAAGEYMLIETFPELPRD